MRKTLRNCALIAFTLLLSAVAVAQETVSGRVIDAETGDGLIGASVVQKGTTNGVITDINGDFRLSVSGNATLVITYVGYEKVEISANEDLGNIEMKASALGLQEIEVLASVATDRKTPVAVSTIKRETILEKASNQEFPELLKSTPGVYATKQGGGYGDGRINLRGFNSENVAVLINGVPVNDMENGRIFWSNWAGLTDVTSSMQVQRGLGASKVAVPSIGGTINILTQNTDAEEGGNIFFGIGNNNYRKMSFYGSTGLMDNDWAFSVAAAKITGDATYADGTQFEGYNYFFNLSKIINEKHSLSLTGFGAPQQHGQRQNRKTIETYQESDRGIRLNTDYGYLDGQLVSVEDNFYHKPQFSLNHYWTITDKMDLSTAVYVSTGTGGGGGTGGTILRVEDNIEGDNDDLYDLEATRQANFDNNDASNGGTGAATGFLRASRNDHFWTGVLSTLSNQVSNKLNIQAGLDLRYYKGKHFTEVTNLLGADYVLHNDDINNPNAQAKVGDKIFYHDHGTVLWQGLFGQAEYTSGPWSVFGSVSASNTSYQRQDFFLYTPDDNKTDFQNFFAYQIKGGANYRLNRNHNVFVNAGYFTKAPFLNSVFINFSNDINPDAEVQKVLSYEAGYGYRSTEFNANINIYRTSWRDRTFVRTFPGETPDDVLIANLLGVDALHQGVEIDFTYKPVKGLDINGMLSIGDWTWSDDLRDIQVFDENQNPVGSPINVFIKDLKVGNSAQTTAALGVNYVLVDGLKVGANLNYYANNYANYDPEDRTNEGLLGVQPWEIPDYFNMDMNVKYTLNIGNNEAILYGNVNNLFNTEYITDANDGTSNTVLVYYGAGRQWTTGIRLKF